MYRKHNLQTVTSLCSQIACGWNIFLRELASKDSQYYCRDNHNIGFGKWNTPFIVIVYEVIQWSSLASLYYCQNTMLKCALCVCACMCVCIGQSHAGFKPIQSPYKPIWALNINARTKLCSISLRLKYPSRCRLLNSATSYQTQMTVQNLSRFSSFVGRVN